MAMHQEFQLYANKTFKTSWKKNKQIVIDEVLNVKKIKEYF